MFRPKLLKILSVLLSVCLCFLSDDALAEESPMRVMSFNIRYGTANDGENDWNHRKEFVVETIKKFNPDILGTQETLGFQRDYLAGNLPNYEVFGVGRDDGKEKGEMMAIYYRKSRFKKLDGGHIWYSETPLVPGSKSWDSSLPRMASGLKLQDLKNEKPVFFFNTHFDHRGEEARRQSASLLRTHVLELARDSPAIITGDFNAPIDSEVYNRLFAEKENSVQLIDTFGVTHPDQRKTIGSAGGFTLKSRGTRRIDWIACTKHFKIISAEIDKTNRNGKTPSDHDPVNAVLTFE